MQKPPEGCFLQPGSHTQSLPSLLGTIPSKHCNTSASKREAW